MNQQIKVLDKNKKYRLACGHNNAATLNIWPFNTWVCLECGYKTDRIEVENES